MAEVREQVLKYIPVLSRPMVMYQKDHPIVWTPIYADLAVITRQFPVFLSSLVYRSTIGIGTIVVYYLRMK